MRRERRGYILETSWDNGDGPNWISMMRILLQHGDSQATVVNRQLRTPIEGIQFAGLMRRDRIELLWKMLSRMCDNKAQNEEDSCGHGLTKVLQ